MPDQTMLVALKCPNCGAPLKVSQEMSAFACGHCGANVVVRREGGTVSLSLEAVIARVQKGTDRTAAELSIPRLVVEISELERQIASHQASLGGWVQHCYGLENSAKGARGWVAPVALAGGVFLMFMSAAVENGSWRVAVWGFVACGVLSVIFRSAFQSQHIRRSKVANAELERQRDATMKATIALGNALADKRQRLAEQRVIADS